MQYIRRITIAVEGELPLLPLQPALQRAAPPVDAAAATLPPPPPQAGLSVSIEPVAFTRSGSVFSTDASSTQLYLSPPASSILSPSPRPRQQYEPDGADSSRSGHAALGGAHHPDLPWGTGGTPGRPRTFEATPSPQHHTHHLARSPTTLSQRRAAAPSDAASRVGGGASSAAEDAAFRAACSAASLQGCSAPLLVRIEQETRDLPSGAVSYPAASPVAMAAPTSGRGVARPGRLRDLRDAAPQQGLGAQAPPPLLQSDGGGGTGIPVMGAFVDHPSIFDHLATSWPVQPYRRSGSGGTGEDGSDSDSKPRDAAVALRASRAAADAPVADGRGLHARGPLAMTSTGPAATATSSRGVTHPSAPGNSNHNSTASFFSVDQAGTSGGAAASTARSDDGSVVARSHGSDNTVLVFRQSTPLLEQAPSSIEAPAAPVERARVLKYQYGPSVDRSEYECTYLCLNVESGQQMAMREISMTPHDTEERWLRCVLRLQREIWFLRRSRNPHVARYFGTELLSERKLRIFKEHVPHGTTFSHMLASFGRLREVVVQRYALQILRGLAHIHSRRIFHGSVTCKNLLCTSDGTVKLMGLGSAYRLRRLAEDESAQPVAKKDVWDLGVVLVRLLTGASIRYPCPDEQVTRATAALGLRECAKSLASSSHASGRLSGQQSQPLRANPPYHRGSVITSLASRSRVDGVSQLTSVDTDGWPAVLDPALAKWPAVRHAPQAAAAAASPTFAASSPSLVEAAQAGDRGRAMIQCARAADARAQSPASTAAAHARERAPARREFDVASASEPPSRAVRRGVEPVAVDEQLPAGAAAPQLQRSRSAREIGVDPTTAGASLVAAEKMQAGPPPLRRSCTTESSTFRVDSDPSLSASEQLDTVTARIFEDLSALPSFPDDVGYQARAFVEACLTLDMNLRPTVASLQQHPFICSIVPAPGAAVVGSPAAPTGQRELGSSSIATAMVSALGYASARTDEELARWPCESEIPVGIAGASRGASAGAAIAEATGGTPTGLVDAQLHRDALPPSGAVAAASSSLAPSSSSSLAPSFQPETRESWVPPHGAAPTEPCDHDSGSDVALPLEHTDRSPESAVDGDDIFSITTAQALLGTPRRHWSTQLDKCGDKASHTYSSSGNSEAAVPLSSASVAAWGSGTEGGAHSATPPPQRRESDAGSFSTAFQHGDLQPSPMSGLAAMSPDSSAESHRRPLSRSKSDPGLALPPQQQPQAWPASTIHRFIGPRQGHASHSLAHLYGAGVNGSLPMPAAAAALRGVSATGRASDPAFSLPAQRGAEGMATTPAPSSSVDSPSSALSAFSHQSRVAPRSAVSSFPPLTAANAAAAAGQSRALESAPPLRRLGPLPSGFGYERLLRPTFRSSTGSQSGLALGLGSSPRHMHATSFSRHATLTRAFSFEVAGEGPRGSGLGLAPYSQLVYGVGETAPESDAQVGGGGGARERAHSLSASPRSGLPPPRSLAGRSSFGLSSRVEEADTLLVGREGWGLFDPKMDSNRLVGDVRQSSLIEAQRRDRTDGRSALQRAFLDRLKTRDSLQGSGVFFDVHPGAAGAFDHDDVYELHSYHVSRNFEPAHGAAAPLDGNDATAGAASRGGSHSQQHDDLGLALEFEGRPLDAATGAPDFRLAPVPTPDPPLGPASARSHVSATPGSELSGRSASPHRPVLLPHGQLSTQQLSHSSLDALRVEPPRGTPAAATHAFGATASSAPSPSEGHHALFQQQLLALCAAYGVPVPPTLAGAPSSTPLPPQLLNAGYAAGLYPSPQAALVSGSALAQQSTPLMSPGYLPRTAVGRPPLDSGASLDAFSVSGTGSAGTPFHHAAGAGAVSPLQPSAPSPAGQRRSPSSRSWLRRWGREETASGPAATGPPQYNLAAPVSWAVQGHHPVMSLPAFHHSPLPPMSTAPPSMASVPVPPGAPVPLFLVAMPPAIHGGPFPLAQFLPPPQLAAPPLSSFEPAAQPSPHAWSLPALPAGMAMPPGMVAVGGPATAAAVERGPPAGGTGSRGGAGFIARLFGRRAGALGQR